MSTALAKLSDITGASPEEVKDVIKGMIVSAKNQHNAPVTNAEMAVVVGTCAKYGLNPLVKECAAFVSSGKLSLIVMIDGYYNIVNRQPTFDGVEFEDKFDDKGVITSVTCRMYLSNRTRPVVVTEYLAECNDIKSSVWKKWPCRMLRHKAYIQAARMAFGLSEIIDSDEADRIRGNGGSNTPAERDITPKPSVNFTDINIIMAECGDLDTLKSACGAIKQELQTNGMWDSVKAEIIALNIKHKDRINADYNSGASNQETESGSAQAIEGELLSAGDGVASSGAENVDAAFGDDEDDIGFGDETDGSFETVTDEFGG